MISHINADFRRCLQRLPRRVQRQARKQYRLFARDPEHPSVLFKQVRPGMWAARVSLGYRALCYREDDELVWFWIGPHAEYDRLVRDL